MNKHIPGPWHVGPTKTGTVVYDSTGWPVTVAVVAYARNATYGTAQANAQLLAAAPEMLSGLLLSINELEQWERMDDNGDIEAVLGKLRGIVAKAVQS